jgi:transcription antitermination factor NusG
MNWFAVHTRSQCEAKVHAALARAGVQDLYPFYRFKSKWTDRRQIIERPVFPGYLFANISDGAARTRVLDATGVVRILGSMIPIPDWEIDLVRRLMESPDSLCAALPAIYEPRLEDLVEVSYGPLIGLQGRVTRTRGKVRVWVSIPSMMAGVPVEVNAQSLRKVRVAA